MKKFLLLLLTLPLVLSVQSNSASIQQDNPSAWPEKISFEKLELNKSHYKQSYDSKKPEFLTEKVKYETKMYNMEGPTGHGLYTTIYYLVEQDEFYVHSDCEMGHPDGFIGPFKGNPKELLAVK